MIRNFIQTFRAYPWPSLIHIAGLSSAFVLFAIVASYSYFEYSYNSFINDAEKTYRVEVEMNGEIIPILPQPLVAAITASNPDISDYGISDTWSEQEISVAKDETSEMILENYCEVSPKLLTDILTLKIIDGEISAINNPKTIVISNSTARKLFGTSIGIIGKTVLLKSAEDIEEHTVGMVYEDMPANSTFGNKIFAKYNEFTDNAKQWNNYCLNLYVRLGDKNHITAFTRQASALKSPNGENYKIKLSPLDNLHFDVSTSFDTTPKGNRTVLSILIAAAIMVVVIAMINFINFALALAPTRQSSVNVKRIFGGAINQIRATLTFETVAYFILALLIGVIVIFLGQNDVWSLIGVDISFKTNYVVYLIVISGFMLISLIVGWLIARMLVKAQTDYKINKYKVGSFRSVLLTVQFTFSICLVIATIISNRQGELIANKQLGFATDKIATFRVREEFINANKLELLKSKLLESPIITDVAFCSDNFAGTDQVGSLGRTYNDKPITFNVYSVSYNFPELMKIPVMDGRGFNVNDQTEGSADPILFLFNRAARQQYNINVDDKINEGCPIVGITENYNYKSLRNTIEPVALMCHRKDAQWGPMPYVYCAIDGNFDEAKAYIIKTINDIDKGYPVEVAPFKAQIDNLYNDENRQITLISIFSIISVIISLMGIVSITLQDVRFKARDIGIRRVFGADIRDILILFSRRFIYVLTVSMVVAVPFMIYIETLWLEQFAYKVTLEWYYFSTSIFIVSLTALGVMVLCCLKTVTQKPVKLIAK